MIPIFKCRASAGGKIMTNPTGKSNYDKWLDAKEKLSTLEGRYEVFKNKDCKSAVTIKGITIPETKALISELEMIKDKRELSKTCKQYLKEWIIEQKYGRRKEFGNKFTEKGDATEQDGFQLIQDVLFKDRAGFLPKNKTQFEDEYFTGCPDIIVVLIDNKSSWNLFTFPIGETEIPDDGYEYQGRIYMRLTKKNIFWLCYTLNNSPMKAIEKECKIWCAVNDVTDWTDIPENVAYEICKNHAFTKDYMRELSFIYGRNTLEDFIEIPKEKRLVKFEIKQDDDIESDMIIRVLDCREWVNENWDKF